MHSCEAAGGSFKACCIGSGGTYSSGTLPSGPYEACSWKATSLSPDVTTTKPVKPPAPPRVNTPGSQQVG
jgi:hypothetical protein